MAQQLRQECGGDTEEPAACGTLEAGRGAQGWMEEIRGFGVLEGGVPSQQSGTQEPRVVRATLYRGSWGGGWAILTGVCTISHDQQAQGAEADVPLTSLSQERPMHVSGLHQCSLGCGGAECVSASRAGRPTEQATCPPTAWPLGFPHVACLEASSAGAVLTLPLLPPHLPLAPQLPLPGSPSPTRGTLLPLAGGGTAEHTPWIRFSSVRQGHQRQSPHRAQPTSTLHNWQRH